MQLLALSLRKLCIIYDVPTNVHNASTRNRDQGKNYRHDEQFLFVHNSYTCSYFCYENLPQNIYMTLAPNVPAGRRGNFHIVVYVRSPGKIDTLKDK